MILNIIHDNRQLDRLPSLIEQCIKYNIRYVIWEACIDKKNVLENITESFRRIIEHAKTNKLTEVLIAEDDCMFVCDLSWEYFFKNKPHTYHCYVGGSYLIDNRYEYKPPLVKVNEWVGNHFILIHESYYDIWLSSKPDGHIDTEQSGRGDFYVSFPYVALQKPSFSANNKAFVNYNSILPEDYILKCSHF